MPDTDYAYDGNRNQYDSMAILSKMPKPDDKNLKIVGITDHDLYAPGRKFVFGENDAAKGVCVISLARLHQSYYGFPEDRALFLERALKEVAHEVGHLIGLSYSPEADNVMHPYENIEEIDCINNYYCIDKK
jgi:archaemetzincin